MDVDVLAVTQNDGSVVFFVAGFPVLVADDYVAGMLELLGIDAE